MVYDTPADLIHSLQYLWYLTCNHLHSDFRQQNKKKKKRESIVHSTIESVQASFELCEYMRQNTEKRAEHVIQSTFNGSIGIKAASCRHF